MITTRRITIILILFVTAIFACQTRIFKKVAVTGTLIDARTQMPLVDFPVALYADDATSAKQSQENTVKLVSSWTRSDGTFNLSCNASRRNRYYLHVGSRDETIAIDRSNIFSIPNNSTKDLGEILVNN